MSFDIFYMSSHFASEYTEQRNKVSGEVQSVRQNLPLTSAEISAVQELIQTARVKSNEEVSCDYLGFPDGGYAELYASDINFGFMLVIRSGFSPNLLNFLYRLLEDGNLLLCFPSEDLVMVGAKESSFDEAPEGMPPKVVCNSPEELGMILADDLDAWKRYRDHVVGE
ncbi:MAG: hypothetical protein CMJ46_01120 [Planctomyces sp.]|nr:hypothetical protein [Planctomyces sp.]